MRGPTFRRNRAKQDAGRSSQVDAGKRKPPETMRTASGGVEYRYAESGSRGWAVPKDAMAFEVLGRLLLLAGFFS
jgi:hypothetical protein